MTHEERSYVVEGLTAEDRKLLAGMPRSATLAGEIAYLRLRIRKLVEAGEKGSDERLLRMLSLLTRMVSAQAKLGEDSTDELAEIADLARRRLIAAGLWRKRRAKSLSPTAVGEGRGEGARGGADGGD